MKYVNGSRTGLVTFYVETAFYDGLLKERYKGDRSDRKTRKKMPTCSGPPPIRQQIQERYCAFVLLGKRILVKK